MHKIVFFQTPDGPVPAEDFIGTQAPIFQNALRTMAGQLTQDNRIEAPRAYSHENDKWSVWIEDDKGNRHNFVLYISPFKRADAPPLRPAQEPQMRFGIYVPQVNARPGEEEWVEASEYIVKHFTGVIQAQLLKALRQAEKSLPGFDATIEWTHNGVILRALRDGKNRQQFQAELRLVREH